MSLPLFSELLEVTLLKPSDTESYGDIVDIFLKKHKLSPEDMQGGSHADVFVVPGKSHAWRVWTSDPAYESFLKYIESRKSNPHFPKLLSRVRAEPLIAKGTPKGVTLKFVKLEKLTPIKDEKLVKILDAIHNDRDLSFDKHVPAVWRDTVKKYQSFFDTASELLRLGADDIDSGNVMMRGEVPVIIDPVHAKILPS